MKSKTQIKRLTRISLLAALMCVIAPLALPIGALPLTLGSFCLYLIALLISPWEGVLAVCVYLTVGMLGIPVFSGFCGGVQMLVSPTGGFLLAYLPAVFFASFLASKVRTSHVYRALSLFGGTVLLYVGGGVGYVFFAGMPFDFSLFLLLLPFFLGEVLKVAAALLIFARLAPFFEKRS